MTLAYMVLLEFYKSQYIEIIVLLFDEETEVQHPAEDHAGIL